MTAPTRFRVRLSRLAGAILASIGDDALYLVGNPKRPLDLAEHGLEADEAIDAMARPALHLRGAMLDLLPPVIELTIEATDAAAAAARVARLFVIERNGAVSERLWRLVLRPEPDADPTASLPARVEARWLGELPPAIWQLVREQVLRCA